MLLLRENVKGTVLACNHAAMHVAYTTALMPECPFKIY